MLIVLLQVHSVLKDHV